MDRKRPANMDFDDDAGPRDHVMYNKRRPYGPPAGLLKLIIPNYVAGGIIGKNGANISQVQSRFNVHIRLSATGEHYPGTDERICCITGDPGQLIEVHRYIMEKMVTDLLSSAPSYDKDRARTVKLLIPDSTAGSLIGKKGATIKGIVDRAGGPKIMVTNKEQEMVPGERTVTITGQPESVDIAAQEVINIISKDEDNITNNRMDYGQFGGDYPPPISENMSGMGRPGPMQLQHPHQQQGLIDSPFMHPRDHHDKYRPNLDRFSPKDSPGLLDYPGFRGNGGGGGTGGVGGGGGGGGGVGADTLSNQIGSISNLIRTDPQISSSAVIDLKIPDHMIGCLLDHDSKFLHDIMQTTDAFVRLSGRGERTKMLSIQGDVGPAVAAHILICNKIRQFSRDHY